MENNNWKMALVYGGITLASAFIGVWGGREVMNVELHSLQESVKLNTDNISRNSEQFILLALQVRELAVTSSRVEDRTKILESWRLEISALAAERGVEIPDIKRRLDKLETRNGK